MVCFILGLYIIAANGFIIPDAVWPVAWVALGVAALCAFLKAVAD